MQAIQNSHGHVRPRMSGEGRDNLLVVGVLPWQESDTQLRHSTLWHFKRRGPAPIQRVYRRAGNSFAFRDATLNHNGGLERQDTWTSLPAVAN